MEISDLKNKQGDFRAQVLKSVVHWINTENFVSALIHWLYIIAHGLQVERLQEELSNEHKRYRDEYDARKLLILDKNELIATKEELERRVRVMQGEQREDVELLKIALAYVFPVSGLYCI